MDGEYLNQFVAAPLQHLRKFSRIKEIKWMNPRACSNEAYVPTYLEHFANILTHGVWILPALLGGMELLRRSHTWTQFVSAWIYGVSLLLVFAVSTSFHCFHYCNRRQLKDVLHRCDRAMIYVFIAASYFPWLMITDFPDNDMASAMKYFIWVMALLGILYQQIFHERYKMLETIFYLIMGVGPCLAVIGDSRIDNIMGLKTGGLLYISGIIFFKADGFIPFAHAIWHLFVTAAAGAHYHAIISHLYPSIDDKDSMQIVEFLQSRSEL